MNWFWMNMPLAAGFFVAWTGIPLWLVHKHPDTSRRPQVAAPQGHTGQAAGPEAAFALGTASTPAMPASPPAPTTGRRHLAQPGYRRAR